MYVLIMGIAWQISIYYVLCAETKLRKSARKHTILMTSH